MNIKIYKNMQKKGSTKDRPEELLAYSIISSHLKGINSIEKQKVVYFNDVNHARLDVEFSTTSGQRYALRMQGPPHEQTYDHDKMQENFLLEKGYIVIDFWYDHMIYLWTRNERLLENYELKLAYEEIRNKFYNFGLKMKKFNLKLIDQSAQI